MTNKLPSQEAVTLLNGLVAAVGTKYNASEMWRRDGGSERYVNECADKVETALSKAQGYIKKLEDAAAPNYSPLERYLGVLLRIRIAENNGDTNFVTQAATEALELWKGLNSVDRILVGSYSPIIEQLKKED